MTVGATGTHATHLRELEGTVLPVERHPSEGGVSPVRERLHLGDLTGRDRKVRVVAAHVVHARVRVQERVDAPGRRMLTSEAVAAQRVRRGGPVVVVSHAFMVPKAPVVTTGDGYGPGT